MADTHAFYRLRTGEVIAVARKRTDGTIQDWLSRDPTLVMYFGQAVDPFTPDGDNVVDRSQAQLGPPWQLGFAKYYDVRTNTVRNATQAEIDTYGGGEDEDEKDRDVDGAKEFMKTHPQHRKMIQALFKAMNRIRTDAGLVAWTRPQIITFIDSNVDRED